MDGNLLRDEVWARIGDRVISDFDLQAWDGVGRSMGSISRRGKLKYNDSMFQCGFEVRSRFGSGRVGLTSTERRTERLLLPEAEQT